MCCLHSWTGGLTIYALESFTLSLSLCFTSQNLLLSTMNKMKNFKRRFSLSVPRTETIEENEFTEQINQLNIRHTQGKNPFSREEIYPLILFGSQFETFCLDGY